MDELQEKVTAIAKASGLDLRNIAPVCPGFVSAVQQLKIGDDDICIDTVHVEEAVYPTLEKLQHEIKNLVIKRGAFSELESSSTPMPKYHFPYEKKLVVYFVTATPQVTLDMVLAKVLQRFPARYTWDFSAYLKDFRNRFLAAARTELHRKHLPPLKRIRNLWRISKQIAFRTRHRNRMKLAASLAVSVHEKHKQSIYQNNICPELIFYTGSLAPRFFSNYTGVDSQLLKQIVPDEILEDIEFELYGPQFKDVYTLALLSYFIITGQEYDGKKFLFDSGPQFDLPQRKYAMISDPQSWLRWLRRPVQAARRARAWAGELHRAIKQYFSDLSDEAKYPEFRKLVRASGTPLRCIPIIRPYLDIWFPTRAARVIRNILDRDMNERMCGKYSRLSVRNPGVLNADLSYLLTGLKPGMINRKTRIDKIIADQASVSTVDIPEVEPPVPRWRKTVAEFLSLSHSRFALAASISAAAVAVGTGIGLWILLGTGNNYSSVVSGDTIAVVSDAAETEKPAHAISKKNRMKNSSKKQSSNKESKSSDKEKKNEDAAGVSAEIHAKASVKEEAVAHDTAASSVLKEMLVPVPGSKKVFRFEGLEGAVNLGDVPFMNNDGDIVPLREHADRFTKFFICNREDDSFGRIKPVRLCQSSNGECEKGKFYEAIGYSGTGGEALVKDGDLFAYRFFDIYSYKRKFK